MIAHTYNVRCCVARRFQLAIFPLLVTCLLSGVSYPQAKDDLRDSPKGPVGCEEIYDFVNDALQRNFHRQKKESVLIMIFRLGDVESVAGLNRRRLQTMKN